MTERWERWAAYGAIAYVVLIAVAIALTIDTPSSDDSPAAWASYFDDHKARFIASGFVVAVAAAFFLWWLAAVRALLDRAEPPSGALTSLAVNGGLVGLVFALAGSAVGTAYPSAVDFYDRFASDGQLAMLLNTTSYWLGTMGLAGGLVMVATVGAIVLRTALLPRWFGRLSVLAAILGVAVGPIWPLAGLVHMAWILTFALLMLGRAQGRG